jgi:hypothetical protein
MASRAWLAPLLALPACRAAPAWEPVGGFELVPRPEAATWRELEPQELERLLAAAHRAAAALRGYSAVLETRERIEDQLFPRRILRVRVRHEPFSVTMETLAPESEAGQRVWWDESWNDGELVAETPGFIGRLVGRVSLDPEGDLALENRRHPITDTGLVRLVEQIEEAFSPALALRPPPRIRAAPILLDGRPGELVEALVPGESPDPALVHRFGLDAATGLLCYYGRAELHPDGPALDEEYLYRALQPNPTLGEAEFRPPSPR